MSVQTLADIETEISRRVQAYRNQYRDELADFVNCYDSKEGQSAALLQIMNQNPAKWSGGFCTSNMLEQIRREEALRLMERIL